MNDNFKDTVVGNSLRSLSGNAYWLEHCSVTHNGNIIKANYSPSLDRLLVGDRLGPKLYMPSARNFAVNAAGPNSS